MKHEIIRIAAVQMECCLGDVERNLEHSIELIQEACKDDVDIVCFPESVLDGYACNEPELLKYARQINSSEVKQIAGMARKHKVWIMWTLVERVDEKVANTAILFRRDGKIQMTYRKVHLSVDINEHLSYIPGERFSVAQLDHARVGVMICFDRHFPEASRTIRLLGADLILHPAATKWFTPNPESINTAMMRTRAYENRCFILSVNQANYGGGSALFGPWGEILAIAGREEQILFCEMDLNLIEEKPDNHFTLIPIRRPETYDLV